MIPRSRGTTQLALVLLACSACGEDGPTAVPAAQPDASSAPSPATADVRDASSLSASDAGRPVLGPPPALADAGPLPQVDAGTAPPRDAAPNDATCGTCAPHESCDKATGQCVDKYQPWQLDCARLPASTTCQGGPREVLLVTGSAGAVAMFDPGDGHFLGYFSRQDLGRDHSFVQAAQGPDQCLYMLDTTSHELQRWSPDGADRGTLHLPGSAAPQSITFSEDRLYLASDDQIQRLTLDGKSDGEFALPGRQLIVNRDGSFLVRQRDALVHLADATGSKEGRTVLAALASSGQVAYAGGGHALLAEYGADKLSYIELETGATKSDEALFLSPFGVAQLGDGKRLVTGMGITVGVAEPGDLAGATEAYAPYAIQGTRLSYIGRACLPEQFVRAQQPDAPLTDCTAPAGATVLAETFDDGDLTDWTAVDGAASWTVETKSASPSLSLGASGALQRDVGVTRPSFLSYRVRITDPGVDQYSPAVSLRSVEGARQLFVGSGSIAPEGTDWFEVQVRDIDWTKGTYDVYTVVAGSCMRAIDDRAFEPKPGKLVLELYQDELGASQLDDIVVK